ncbi:putative membrane protein [Peribacillus deserti]|uniref:Membrane protein n=1 Tax=Peribacillus deserti TaxID=673318 RepID=A0ABS2QNH5_9BACI|nr:hypothetical protein [Peribacillus deserti]MBM7694304.1 putative membrane protein [Peribacillus deserti]
MSFWSKGMAGWLILCIVFIYLVDLFTVDPDVTSGNGNLGLLFVLPALFVFLLFASSFWNFLGRLEFKSNTWMKLGLGALALLLWFFRI